MVKLKTLKIKESTHRELNKIKGKLLQKTGEQVTFDDVITWLIDQTK